MLATHQSDGRNHLDKGWLGEVNIVGRRSAERRLAAGRSYLENGAQVIEPDLLANVIKKER